MIKLRFGLIRILLYFEKNFFESNREMYPLALRPFDLQTQMHKDAFHVCFQIKNKIHPILNQSKK